MRIHTHTHTHTHTHSHTHTLTHKHTCTHTNTHTLTHNPKMAVSSLPHSYGYVTRAATNQVSTCDAYSLTVCTEVQPIHTGLLNMTNDDDDDDDDDSDSSWTAQTKTTK